MHQATLKTFSQDVESISRALNVDNEGEKMMIKTGKGKMGKVVSKVETNSTRTLLSTLDDLIHCQMIAENLIHKEVKDG